MLENFTNENIRFSKTGKTDYRSKCSFNGSDFIVAGKQVATRNGTEKTNYTFNDLQALNGNITIALKLLTGMAKEYTAIQY